MPTDLERLRAMLAAGHAGLRIITNEEEDAADLVRAVARDGGHHLWTWTLLEGVTSEDGAAQGTPPPTQDDPAFGDALLADPAHDQGAYASPQTGGTGSKWSRASAAPAAASNPRAVANTEQPAAGLYWLSEQTLPSVVMLFDVAAHAADPHAIRALRRLLASAERHGSTVVLIDHADSFPDAIKSRAALFTISLPDDEAIDDLVRTELKRLHKQASISIELTGKQYEVMVRNLRGLTKRQARQVVRDVVAEDRTLSAADLNHVIARKRELVASEGALEYVESPLSLDDIGGLTHLKAWLGEREGSFDDKAHAFGLRPPRGVLMLGVQGAGKSLCSKAIATAWGRPLLRLDPGGLYDRYVGESEKRLRDALKQAEMMAPIVLWIDEIEKGFASAAAQSTDGGLSQRMFGTLLTWMQDHEAPVFLVATANNIEALPPELLRKGRFDEIFFVDLPGPDAREKIFEIHLRKRSRDASKFDLPRLAAAADGFSGAEIEQAVVAALHAAYSSKTDVTTESIVAAVRAAVPLSVTMGEKIDRLRAWAADRCVMAG